MSSVQRRVCRGESREGWAEVGDLLVSWGHGGYLSWLAAKTHVCPCLGIRSCCTRSLLIPWTPDTSQDREDRGVQSWPHLSLAVRLEELTLYLGGVNELALRA